MIWTTENVERIILDTAARIAQKSFAGLPASLPAGFDLKFDLGLTSIQQMELAAHLNEFFSILQTSANNYLLANTTLDHWTNCIVRAREQYDEAITFRTSGTTGASKSVRHSMKLLLAEAQFLAQILPQPNQVISTVPANHIYGFIFTILLPTRWERPVRKLADITLVDITDKTLIIGTPFTWEFLHTSLFQSSPRRCWGVTSTAPMPTVLFEQLAQAGISLTEIYGSSDTSGVGYRQLPNAPFTLYPYLSIAQGEPATIANAETNITYLAPDRLDRISDREWQVLGRLDNAIQIAGVNVYPDHIRQVIETCPLVAECDIYAKADAGISQLYGAVRLRTHAEANRDACHRWIREHLTAPEIPKHLYLY